MNFGRLLALAGVISSVSLISCRTLPPLPSADLSAPGWKVQQGQAVWKALAEKPEIAGELLLATNQNGNFFVQFTKSPFTLVSAQLSGEQWQLEFGGGERSFRGRGQPPARFVWFQLPRALVGQPLDVPWQFMRSADFWRFENARTGESLEGAFFP